MSAEDLPPPRTVMLLFGVGVDVGVAGGDGESNVEASLERMEEEAWPKSEEWMMWPRKLSRLGK